MTLIRAIVVSVLMLRTEGLTKDLNCQNFSPLCSLVAKGRDKARERGGGKKKKARKSRYGISGLLAGQSSQEGVIIKDKKKAAGPLFPPLHYVIREVSVEGRKISVRRESRSVRTFNYVILGTERREFGGWWEGGGG